MVLDASSTSSYPPDQDGLRKPEIRDEIPYFTRGPLSSNGSLDGIERTDLTPVIGTEFSNVNLLDWINAPNSDELLRELALTISIRGVVFFRAQTDLTDAIQKDLVHRLGVLSGKPSTSSLHIHPVLNTETDIPDHSRVDDKEISTISSKLVMSVYNNIANTDEICDRRQSLTNAWHSDVAFEPSPPDYTSLRMTRLPPTGGDTMFASTYEAYDRVSPTMQHFISGLTATYARPDFTAAAKRSDISIYAESRGSPYNVGDALRAVHPVVRTNPVTGWRSVFPVGQHVTHINGCTRKESAMLTEWLLSLVVENHDLQLRYNWQNEGDLAIWDNRCTVHAMTFDFEGLGDRSGNRAVGIGERPFLDPKSKGRRDDLAEKGVKFAGYFPTRR